MDVVKIDTVEGLEDLGVIWDGVVEKNSVYVPFITHSWVKRWWRWFGSEMELFVLVVKDGDEVAGIAPLMLHRKSAGVRTIEFMTNDTTSRFDFIVLPEKRERVIESILDYLLENNNMWDQCLFNYLPCFSGNYPVLKQLLDNKEFFSYEHFFQSPSIVLDSDWEAFLSARGKKFRGNLRNYINKSEREGLVCSMFGLDGDADAVMNRIVEVEKNTWKYREGTSIVSDERMSGFFCDAVRDAAASGNLYLGLMDKDGQPVAYDLNWAHGDTVFSLKMGYDERYSRFAPGKVLFAYTVRKSIEDNFKFHDLMGMDESFKTEWTSTMRQHSRLHVNHKGMKSRLNYYFNNNLKGMARSLKGKISG